MSEPTDLPKIQDMLREHFEGRDTPATLEDLASVYAIMFQQQDLMLDIFSAIPRTSAGIITTDEIRTLGTNLKSVNEDLERSVIKLYEKVNDP